MQGLYVMVTAQDSLPAKDGYLYQKEPSTESRESDVLTTTLPEDGQAELRLWLFIVWPQTVSILLLTGLSVSLSQTDS